MGNSNSNVQPNACRTNCQLPFCGDGVKDVGEECDDGNANERDGCTWRCLISICGNGVLETPEECDEGSGNSDTEPDGCRSVCRIAFCGDGVRDENEECDDGNRDTNDVCSNACILACPEGATKVDGRCVIQSLDQPACGFFCSIRQWFGGLFS